MKNLEIGVQSGNWSRYALKICLNIMTWIVLVRLVPMQKKDAIHL